jgi:aspartate 1-decarboxylase
MNITILKSKIHRAKVVGANINYEGSITIYKELMRQAQIQEYEQVHVVNINNGERFVTYAIKGEKENDITLNGAAARCAQPGDVIIIMTYASINNDEITNHLPVKILLGENNKIIKIN